MAVKVDLDARTLTCSVHDLLPESMRRSLGLPGEGLSRLSVGSELHRLVQAQRTVEEPEYVPEATVDARLSIDGWSLRMLGRADGVIRQGHGGNAVEEIKTLDFRSELHHPAVKERMERYRWQVRLYAFALFPDGDAAARLLLVDLGGEKRRVEEVAWSPAEVAAFLRGRLHALVAAAREQEHLREVWRQAAKELPFPHAEPRLVQLEAMQAVEEALASGRHLLLAAPTGVGKTAAALYPAVRRALAMGRRVAFLTAKTMQQKLAVETLQAMQRGGWHSIQVRAKAKMCANHEVICHEEFCQHARDLGIKLAQRAVLPSLLSFAPHLDPERIYDVSHAAEVCPFEVSLELVRHARAVVCDYNYVFDPFIALSALVEEGELEETFLVIDEAHNLVDRAREYYSPWLRRTTVREALQLVERFPARVCRDLENLLLELDAALVATVNEALGERGGASRVDMDVRTLAQVRLSLDALIPSYFTFKRGIDLWLAEDPVVEVLLALARVVDLLEDGGEELVPLAQRDEDGSEALRIFCLDASRFTRRILDGCAGCIAMSATLEPFDFYRDLLGFEPDRTDTLTLPSPFPPENRLVLVVDDVDTSYRQRSRAFEPIARLVEEMAPAGRNALVLFPSYAFLREVRDRLRVDSHRVEVQGAGDSDQVRRQLLDLLRTNHEPVLLLAVLGGVFAEGVDYPGEMLSEVLVVSPALPQVGPERELLKSYFAQRYERGFEYAYLVPGMTRVVQAAGRLIRSAEDRGVIALVCRRFLREPYRSLLPSDWTAGEPAALRVPDPVAAVRAFFDGES